MIDFLLALTMEPLVLAPSGEVKLPAIPSAGDYVYDGPRQYRVTAIAYSNSNPKIYIVVDPITAAKSPYPSAISAG